MYNLFGAAAGSAVCCLWAYSFKCSIETGIKKTENAKKAIKILIQNLPHILDYLQIFKNS